jgi:hypothetical protein
MSISTLFAVRDALDSARKDAGDTADYYEMSKYKKKNKKKSKLI